ncbi:MAG: glycosyltransferase family 2 protein [Eubacteriales bacterium]|nr:glycosyltransferase family 2 protein [Eubacteriales bacterium]
MNTNAVTVMIPAYHPGAEFEILLKRLSGQTVIPEEILVINTDQKGWNEKWEEEYPLLRVIHISKREFDHGATRRRAAEECRTEYMVFMTQDAIPGDRHLLENLLKALEQEKEIAAAYARQLPRKDCNLLERLTRVFNYPEKSHVRYEKDTAKYGIKTYFCSNVCAAYKKSVYEALGGFPEKAIFNEDMIYAGKLIQNRFGIAYAADAKVIHSHNYSGIQQFHRNFDLGVSQAEHPEIFEAVPSESEGIRMVKKNAAQLISEGHMLLLPKLVWISGWKFLGYRFGKGYKKLPKCLIRKMTMNPGYWS